jgi:hypothetical protein
MEEPSPTQPADVDPATDEDAAVDGDADADERRPIAFNSSFCLCLLSFSSSYSSNRT